MQHELKHPQLQWVRQHLSLTDSVTTVPKLIEAIKDAADRFNSDEEKNRIRGDAFEVFVEFFMYEFGHTNQVGIREYQPGANDHEDYGVDGTGIDIGDGDPAAVQAKFRSNPKDLVTHTETAKFFMQAIADCGVPAGKLKNLLVVTTAFGLNEHAEKMYGSLGGRTCALNDLIAIIGEQNWQFWEDFRNSINNSQKERQREIKDRYPHQKDMTNAGLEFLEDDEETRGWIACGTGGGKTFTINDLAELWLNDHSTVVIASPRIRLTEQIKSVLHSQKRLDYDRITFHSGGKEELENFIDEQVFRQNSTTNEEKMKEWLAKSKPKRIIFTTYHSSLKLNGILKETEVKDFLYLADECHNLVTVDFSNVLKEMAFAKFIGFTGTPKETRDPNGDGMNNYTRWGKCLSEISAAMLASNGITVPPRIYLVNIKDNRDAEQLEVDMVNKAVRHFKDEVIGDHSCKVIITCTSVRIAHRMADTTILDQLEDFEKCVVTSDRKKMGTRTTEQQVNKFARATNALMFHYDMLGEGIDVPSVTAVLPMRSLNTIKAVQNVGRANRLVKQDRKRYMEGDLDVFDRSNWDKPYAWVICPHVISDIYSNKAYENMLRILKTLRDEERPVEEYLYVADPDTNEHEEHPESYSPLIRVIQQKVIEDLEFELEKEEEALRILKRACTKGIIEVNYEMPKDDQVYLEEQSVWHF